MKNKLISIRLPEDIVDAIKKHQAAISSKGRRATKSEIIIFLLKQGLSKI